MRSQSVTSAQLAEELQVSTRTLTRWRIEGSGPPFYVLGRSTVRYPRDQLDEWLAARTFRSVAHSRVDGG